MSPMTTRRSLLAGTAALPLATIGGCALLQPGPNQAMQIQNFLTAITNGAQGIIPALQALGSQVPPGVLTNAQTAVNVVRTNAAAISAQIASGISVHGVSQGLTDLVSAASLLSGILAPFFPTAPLIGAVVEAVLTAAQAALAAAQGTAAVARGAMTPDAAVRLLNAKPLG